MAMDKTQRLVNAALAMMHERTKHDSEEFDIGSGRWEIDASKGIITFQHDEKKAVATIQVIGTRNPVDQTWLWAWNNPSVPDHLLVHAQVIREYGAQHKLHTLTMPMFECSVAVCWELMALAFDLNDVGCVYRATHALDTPEVWVTYTGLHRVE